MREPTKDSQHVPPLKLNSSPLKSYLPNRKGLSSNHHSSGVFAVKLQGVHVGNYTSWVIRNMSTGELHILSEGWRVFSMAIFSEVFRNFGARKRYDQLHDVAKQGFPNATLSPWNKGLGRRNEWTMVVPSTRPATYVALGGWAPWWKYIEDVCCMARSDTWLEFPSGFLAKMLFT